MRNNENQSAAAQHRGQAQRQQEMIQTIEKRRCLIVGFEHSQAHGWIFSPGKLQRGNDKTFFAQLNFFRP